LAMTKLFSFISSRRHWAAINHTRVSISKTLLIGGDNQIVDVLIEFNGLVTIRPIFPHTFIALKFKIL
jgi:hypothetical protein